MSVSPPVVNLVVVDGALGNVPSSPADVIAVFGPSQSGTEDLPTRFSGQPGDVVAQYGYGPGPSLVAALVASGIQAVFTKVATNAPGAAGSVTHVGTGLSVMTVTGTPNDRYDIIVSVQASATAGDTPGPSVSVSFDGNVSTSRAVRVPSGRSVANFVTQTGLTFVFSAATMVAGDTYTLSTTAPTVAAADVATAVDALRTTKIQAALGYCVGEFDAADATTIAASVAEYATLGHRYVRFFVESVDQDSGQSTADWIAELEADFASFVDDRIAVPAGYALVLDPVTKFSLRRSVGWLGAVRAGTTGVGTDPGQVALGPLVPFGGAAAVTTVFYDEFLTPGLGHDGRFYTLQSYNGRLGYYVSCPCLMSGPTSDFDMIQLGRLMDESCRIADFYFTGILGSPVRINKATGFILKKDRLNIQEASDRTQAEGLVNAGQASSISTSVSDHDNILSTKTLTVTISIVPNGDVREVDLTMTFLNPALQVAAA
jgi:hypothetical protein